MFINILVNVSGILVKYNRKIQVLLLMEMKWEKDSKRREIFRITARRFAYQFHLITDMKNG